MDKLTSLRKKHSTFLYENFGYNIDGNSLRISFLFKISPDIEFNPKITIENIDDKVFANLAQSVIQNFIFNLGMIEMISYWKATCSPTIEIKAGNLDQNQIDWWKNLLIKGLGEFFYHNSINFKEYNFLNIKSVLANNYQKDENSHQDRYIVMNSGGHDSVVSLELLKELGKDIILFMLNPTKASTNVAKESGISSQIIVTREIDDSLLKLNENGYLNGHTPFSAYLAFLSSLCALLTDCRFVLSSNERSANEENVEFLEEKINHQYSKSFEFEKSFRDYLRKNLSSSIEYLSLLRPLYEIQISKIFANHKNYFKKFKSCNIGQKNNTWCAKCAKCLSIYTSLYPFLEKNQMNEIFDEDLYSKGELSDLLLHITGKKKPKPFECVETYEEVLLGLSLSVKKEEKAGNTLPILLQYAKDHIVNESLLKPGLISAWDENNFLPQELSTVLKNKI